MAQRRMFSLKIVGSDAFLEMPTSARELYFQLGMYADDDGFVSPRKTMRMIGASEDDLRVLIAKRFVLPFETGVVVVKHWLINNLVRKDFYQETLYLEEKKTLKVKENKGYTEIVNNLSPQVRLGKDRLLGADKPRVVIVPENEDKPQREKKDTSYRVVFEAFGEDYPFNWRANRTEIAAAKNILVEHSIEEAKNALAFAETYSHEEMCPQILKPSDLDRKWVNLQAFRDKR